MRKHKAETLHRLREAGFSYPDANALRRASLTLTRWGERECGDGSNWAIERDETTGKPFNVYHGEGKPMRHAIPDREAGALKRIAAVLARYHGWLHFHQTDPRGASLYLLRKEDVRDGEQLDCIYSRGIAVY